MKPTACRGTVVSGPASSRRKCLMVGVDCRSPLERGRTKASLLQRINHPGGQKAPQAKDVKIRGA